MAAFLALMATVLTSFLPILNKHLLRDARPALVAWITNAASLPILAVGTLLGLKGSRSVLEELLLPAVEHRRPQTQFLT